MCMNYSYHLVRVISLFVERKDRTRRDNWQCHINVGAAPLVHRKEHATPSGEMWGRKGHDGCAVKPSAVNIRWTEHEGNKAKAWEKPGAFPLNVACRKTSTNGKAQSHV